MESKSMIENSTPRTPNLDLTINDFRTLSISSIVNNHKFRKERKKKCENYQICRGYGNINKKYRSHYVQRNCPFNSKNRSILTHCDSKKNKN